MLKRALWTIVLALMAAGSGCQHHNLACNSCNTAPACQSCQTCGPAGCMAGGQMAGGQMAGGQMAGGGCRGCGMLAGAQAGRPAQVGNLPPQDMGPGPQSGTYAYPWYTTLGPRDFLMNNPPSIGR